MNITHDTSKSTVPSKISINPSVVPSNDYDGEVEDEKWVKRKVDPLPSTSSKGK